jgi:hypothetical protein
MKTQATTAMNDELLAICKLRGLTEEDLDELVIDASLAKALPGINEEEQPSQQEGLFTDAESRASSINNGGLDEQIAFLAAHHEFVEIKRILQELEHDS